jgi:hypothetical protein
MLVVDLHCESGHLFEGWFASANDLASQKERGLLSCPVCGSREVVRRPSASRLNVSALKASKLEGSLPPVQPVQADRAATSSAASEPRSVGTVATHTNKPHANNDEAAAVLQTMQALYLQAVRHVLANTEDVGDRFVDEVRGMHHGDVPERAIRGQASPEERAELREEGIDVLSMPIPAELKGPLQ